MWRITALAFAFVLSLGAVACGASCPDGTQRVCQSGPHGSQCTCVASGQ